MEDIMQNPTMEVFAITNGYLLVTHFQASKRSIVYAKDAVGISEAIIAAQARRKLNVEPRQGEMFTSQEMGNSLSSGNMTITRKKAK